MPDVYSKGEGHRPVVGTAGHFHGMHAPERGAEIFKPEQLWYRGDDVEALRAENVAKTEHIANLEHELACWKMRRPPKRAPPP